MSNPINDGGPAFPHTEKDHMALSCPGMSLRDWFAGQALAGYRWDDQALSAEPEDGADDPVTADDIAEWAYLLADSMLERRDCDGGVWG